jgi:3-phenylpropionate/cinnamic acid dioxygenase small subunit
MSLPIEDRMAVTELIYLHGHIVDAGEFDRLGELFTADVTYDVSDLGGEPLIGIAAIREASLRLGAGNPVAHHVTNVVLEAVGDDQVAAQSKGFGVRTDGTVGSVVYQDLIVRTPHGWRISHRTVRARRTPLSAG